MKFYPYVLLRKSIWVFLYNFKAYLQTSIISLIVNHSFVFFKKKGKKELMIDPKNRLSQPGYRKLKWNLKYLKNCYFSFCRRGGGGIFCLFCFFFLLLFFFLFYSFLFCNLSAISQKIMKILSKGSFKL